MKASERTYLSASAKRTFHVLSESGFAALCYDTTKPLDELERAGFVAVAWDEGHIADDAAVTPKGKTYYRENPTLSNPTDWRLIVSLITAVAALASLIVSILAFIACNKLLC